MLTFLRQTVTRFHDTGAIAPSSRWLARALAAPLASRDAGPRQILEAGPGTGAVTAEIVKHLRPGDRLVLSEINPVFVAHLERRLRGDPRLSPWRGQIEIRPGPVQGIEDEARFAHIVCGLPFNNFDPSLVREIFAVFRRALQPGGTLGFFEYAGVRRLKALLAGRSERVRLREVARAIQAEISRSEAAQRLVLLNLPPARVHCLRF